MEGRKCIDTFNFELPTLYASKQFRLSSDMNSLSRVPGGVEKQQKRVMLLFFF